MGHDDRTEIDTGVTFGHTDTLNTAAAGKLVHLGNLDDFEIADGEPDIRGWDVRGADGILVGKVEDLLIDTAAMKVRYIEVKLEKDVAQDIGRPSNLRTHGITDAAMQAEQQLADRSDLRRTDGEAGRFVLVPIGIARLNDDDDDVMLSAEAARMVGIPSYDRAKEHLTRDYESEVVRGYGTGLGSGGIATNDVMNAARPPESQLDTLADARDPFYDDRSFDDRSFFSSRRRGRDDDSYFARADRDVRSRARQRDARGATTDNDDVTNRDTIRAS